MYKESNSKTNKHFDYVEPHENASQIFISLSVPDGVCNINLMNISHNYIPFYHLCILTANQTRKRNCELWTTSRKMMGFIIILTFYFLSVLQFMALGDSRLDLLTEE